MKQKVLIVEDNISLSQRQKDWLEQAGYDVMTAMREPAARALIRKHRFDSYCPMCACLKVTEYRF